MLLESRYFTTMKATSSKSFFIFLAYLTCCAWAWPAVAPSVYRQNSNANANYIPYTSNVAYEPVDYQLPVDNYNYNGQWERAREPQSYYDLVDDYWMNQPTSDVEPYSNLADLYDPPVWGQVVNEKPESELEELKAEERQREEEERVRAFETRPKYYAYDYSGHQEKRGPVVKPPAAQATTTSTVDPSTTSKSASTVTATPKTARVQHHQPGQKEVPLLRPPTKGKPHSSQPQENGHQEFESEEPVISVAQRSAAEKPSAYDTLRKYISLEDALKKEAEKRRSTASRLQKRAPAGKKQIVSDIDSLSGQLNNLKKSVI